MLPNSFFLFYVFFCCFVKNIISQDEKLLYDGQKESNSDVLMKNVKLYLKTAVGKDGKNLDVFKTLISLSNPMKVIGDLKEDWRHFKSKFGKKYLSIKDEAERFVNFLENFLVIKKHNELFNTGRVGFSMSINHLSDLSDAEYSSLLGAKIQKKKTGMKYLSPMAKIDFPISIDWRSTAVTPVKDQGKCGSCWAFSSTGALEGQHYRKTLNLVSLSEQQLVDCSIKNYGCEGGQMNEAFEYIKENGGIDLESTYPYVSGKTGKREDMCMFNSTNIGAQVSGYKNIDTGNETKLKEAVALIGPISVAIDANHKSFMHYSKGVYEEAECSSTNLDHAVLVVGYGVDEVSNVPYWLVKNSWNTMWGDQGYIKMKRDYNNMCGIASDALYPLV